MYYFIFLYLLLLKFIPIKSSRNFNSKIVKTVLGLLPILLLAVFRYGVGADYFSYNYIYEKLIYNSVNIVRNEFPNTDLGFLYFMKLFTNTGLSYQYFVALLSAIQISAVGVWIVRNSKDEGLSIIIYYAMFLFVWNFSALRQGLVISLSLLLLFDKNQKHSSILSVIGIGLFSLIHSSALILYLILIIQRLDFSKRSILIIFVGSILFSVLPLTQLLSPFSSIGIVSRFMEYASGGGIRNLVTFASLARIVIFVGTVLFYDVITKDLDDKKLVDIFLIGFSVYFLLSFAPVAAGRFAIYFYFLAVLVFPMITQGTYGEYSRLSYLVSPIIYLVLISFLGLSFMKELSSMVYQSEYIKTDKLTNYTNVFNKETPEFKSIYAFLVGLIDDENKLLSNEIKLEPNKSNNIVSATKDDNYYSVWSESHQGYIIINQKGERVTDFLSSVPVPIYGEIVQKYNLYEGYPVYQFENIITGERIDKVYVTDSLIQSFYQDVEFPVHQEISIDELDEQVLNLFEERDQISLIEQKWFVDSMYYIYEVTYYGARFDVYTDLNNKPFVNQFFASRNRIKNKDFIIVEGMHTRQIYNLNNELIWIEPSLSTEN